jgi:hypothetical protein
LTTTAAPSAASRFAMPAPMPRAAPVTIATLLLSLPILFSEWLDGFDNRAVGYSKLI